MLFKAILKRIKESEFKYLKIKINNDIHFFLIFDKYLVKNNKKIC
jgi:hypothetical protein